MIPTRHGLTSSPNTTSPVDVERVCRIMAYAEEFEDRWFWETDAEGNFTYLSQSVARELELFGLKTIGGKISDVFKIDQSAADVNRSLGFHIISRTAFANYSVRGARGLHENWWSISGRPWFDADGNFLIPESRTFTKIKDTRKYNFARLGASNENHTST